jgi:DNA-binding Lrp family transcriptional regulator
MEMAFVLLTSETGFERDVLEDLKGISEVKEALRLYGVYDIILQVEVDTREDLKELVREIKQMEKVRSTFTMIVI